MKKILGVFATSFLLTLLIMSHPKCEPTTYVPLINSPGQVSRNIPYGYNIYSSTISGRGPGVTVTTVTNVPGILGGYFFYNPSQSNVFCQFFDVTTATLTTNIGVTAPYFQVVVTSQSVVTPGFDEAINFNNGIAFACTIGSASGTLSAVQMPMYLIYHQ